MSKLQILEFPDPRLRKIAEPVEVVDDSIRQLVDDMFETMYDARGIGLAATQVNVHKRVVVIDLSEDKSGQLVLINPEVTVLEGEPLAMQEGCLSVPGFYEDVTRIEHVLLKALGRDGQPYELEATGLLAVCIQHELDHLNGKLFRSEDKSGQLVLINPEVTVLEGEPLAMQEGCLSVPGFYEDVTRIEHVLLKALGRDGQPYELEATGLLAVCIQHELDHLNGKLF